MSIKGHQGLADLERRRSSFAETREHLIGMLRDRRRTGVEGATRPNARTGDFLFDRKAIGPRCITVRSPDTRSFSI
jgi:hypothetical protein